MRLNKQKILHIFVTTNSKGEILEYLQMSLKRTSEKEKKVVEIVTPNPEQAVLAEKNAAFRETINQADVAIPDGIGLVWAGRFLGLPQKYYRITGVELMNDLVGLADKEGAGIGLIGGRGDVAVKALECLKRSYPSLKGWADGAPELHIRSHELSTVNKSEDLDRYNETIVQKIKETDTKIVFVGLGAPKQEYFMEKLQLSLRDRSDGEAISIDRHALRARDDKYILLMAVGGAFDEISGRLPMSPKFIDRIGLKWLWRLIIEPRRWKRQLALVEFVLLVLKEKLMS